MTKMIPLTQGQVALVSDDKFEYINQWKWCARKDNKNGKWYAIRKGFGKTILMHRVVINAGEGVLVDHRDGNGINNQSENLRTCTSSQNQANRGRQANNTSGFCGVVWNKELKKWRAYITVSKRQIHLKYHSDIEDAAKAHDKAAKEYFGEFAVLNFNEK